VCTKLCASDDACEIGTADGMCRSAEQVQVAESCEGGRDAVSLCVPSCENDRDCPEAAPGSSCERGVCVVVATPDAGPAGDAEPSDNLDASTPDAGDASDLDAADDSGSSTPDTGSGMEPDSGLPAPALLTVDCEQLGTSSLPAGLDQVASTDWAVELTADDDAAFGAHLGSSSTLWQVPVPVTAPEDLLTLQGMEAADALAIDGDELFFGGGDSEQAVVGKVSRSSGSLLYLAREPVLINVRSILVAGNAVYWLASDGLGTQTTTLSRSDRNPGATQMLTTVEGGYGDSLQRVGEWLYFLVHDDDQQAQLVRAPLDGSAPAEPLGELGGLSALLSTGTALFGIDSGGTDRLGNPTGDPGVVRVGLEDGALELLFPAAQVRSGVLALDTTYLYWVTGPQIGGIQTLWRGRRDGTDEGVKLVDGWQNTTELAVTTSFLYWTAICPDGGHVLRLAKSSLEP
jgi:hypothetical protein